MAPQFTEPSQPRSGIGRQRCINFLFQLLRESGALSGGRDSDL
jgi:hypothetical protein